MKRIKQFIPLTIFGAITIVCGIILPLSSNSLSMKFASASNEWVHYNKVSATTDSVGIKEYWVSCNTHEHRFHIPSGDVNIKEGGTPTREFINSLDSSDDRLIKPYTRTFNFDDNFNSYITIHDNFDSLEIVNNEGIGGSKALKATRSSSLGDAHLSIDKGYLDYIFSDNNVKSLSFYAKGTIKTNNFRHKTVDKQYVNNNNNIISCYEINNTGYGIDTTYKQFYLTRGVYSQMGDNDWFIQYGASGSFDLYLDNFSICYDDYYDYSKNSLEYGNFEKESTFTYNLRDASSGGANLIIITNNASNTVSPDYQNYTDGRRSLKINKTTSSEVHYYLRGDYSYNNLPDEGIYFDFYSTVAFNGWWSGQDTGAITDGNNKPFVSEVNETIRANSWYTFHFTKAMFNSSGRFLMHKSPVGTMYIDNIRLATREIDSFESATAFQITAPSFDTNDGYGGASKNYLENNETDIKSCLNNNNFIFASRWKVCTAAVISDEKASDGLYSLKLTKTSNGTMEINPQYLKIMGDDGVLTFDAYTDDLNRLTATTLGNKTLTLSKGQWVTLTLTKDDINSSGRFTTNAFGAGTIYIDNICITHTTNYVNNGVIHGINGQTAALLTVLSTNNIRSLVIDNNTAPIIDKSSNKVDFAHENLSVGVHKAIVTYYHDGHYICDYIYFECVSFASSNTALNVSADYGDNSYYTLSGYSGVYRMMVDDKEFPYEVSGSNYLLPKAALVQLLPEQNNQKVNGTINLKIFTLDAKYIVPINITLTNSVNVKTLPSYNGEGIATHAYSSTNSHVSRTDYEQYFGMEQISEYQNTGLKMMYEQALHVGLYDYTLPDALKYEFTNAYKLNQSVMIVDSSFTLLSKYNVSLIGTDLYESIDSVGNPTGNKYTNTRIPKVNDNYRFSSTSELDDFVEYRLKLYINEPGCFGVNVGDEHTYNMLNGGFKDIFASIKRVLAKLNRTDFYVNANLQPLTASEETMTGQTSSGTFTDAKREQSYVTYLTAFMNCSGLDFIQFDAYPFADSSKGGIYEGKGLNKYYLRNIIIVAEFCKTNDLDLYMVTQSVTYYGSRILNRADISWINNMIVGMGVKHLSFFVYCVRANTGSEVWLDNSAFLTKDGVRNDLYYYYQAQIHEMNAFAPIISCFTYEWVHLYKYTWSSSSAGLYSQATSSSYYSSSSSYGELSGVSTNKDWTLATGLKNPSDGKYMYMVQNIYNNFDNEALQKVTLTFNQNYEYAVIYEAGLPRVVTMNAKKLELQLSAGHAAYIMVY